MNVLFPSLKSLVTAAANSYSMEKLHYFLETRYEETDTFIKIKLSVNFRRSVAVRYEYVQVIVIFFIFNDKSANDAFFRSFFPEIGVRPFIIYY